MESDIPFHLMFYIGYSNYMHTFNYLKNQNEYTKKLYMNLSLLH